MTTCTCTRDMWRVSLSIWENSSEIITAVSRYSRSTAVKIVKTGKNRWQSLAWPDCDVISICKDCSSPSLHAFITCLKLQISCQLASCRWMYWTGALSIGNNRQGDRSCDLGLHKCYVDSVDFMRKILTRRFTRQGHKLQAGSQNSIVAQNIFEEVLLMRSTVLIYIWQNRELCM